MRTHFRHQVLVVRAHERVGLGSAQLALREVSVHLVSVKVGVVGLAVSVMQAEHFLSGQDASAVGLDRRSVQSGLTVQQQHIPILDVPIHLQEKRSSNNTERRCRLCTHLNPNAGSVLADAVHVISVEPANRESDVNREALVGQHKHDSRRFITLKHRLF